MMLWKSLEEDGLAEEWWGWHHSLMVDGVKWRGSMMTPGQERAVSPAALTVLMPSPIVGRLACVCLPSYV